MSRDTDSFFCGRIRILRVLKSLNDLKNIILSMSETRFGINTKQCRLFVMSSVLLLFLLLCLPASSSASSAWDDLADDVNLPAMASEGRRMDINFQKYQAAMPQLYEFVRDPCAKLGAAGNIHFEQFDMCVALFRQVANHTVSSRVEEISDTISWDGGTRLEPLGVFSTVYKLVSSFRKESCWSRLERTLQTKCFTIMDFNAFKDIVDEMATCLMEDGDKERRSMMLANAGLFSSLIPFLCQTSIVVDIHKIVSTDLKTYRVTVDQLMSEIKSDKEELGRYYSENAYLREEAERHRRDDADITSLGNDLHVCLGFRESMESLLNISRDNENRLNGDLLKLEVEYDQEADKHMRCVKELERQKQISWTNWISHVGTNIVWPIMGTVCTVFIIVACVILTIVYVYRTRPSTQSEEEESRTRPGHECIVTPSKAIESHVKVKLCKCCNENVVRNPRSHYCSACKPRV